jgi:hypothetical protein
LPVCIFNQKLIRYSFCFVSFCFVSFRFVSFRFVNSGSGSITYDIIPDEELEVSIYTRSTAGAKWTISDAKNKNGTTWVGDVETKHVGDDLELPSSHFKLTKANIKGPVSIKIKAESFGGRWTSEKFLVVVSVFNP